MLKRILLLPILVFILSACDKTKDPGVEIPKTIDQTIIGTVWNTTSEKYQYKNTDGSIAYESNKVYEDPRNKSIQYNFHPNAETPDDHRLTKLNKFTNKTIKGSWELLRESKKDYVLLKWDSGITDKYEITSFSEKTMSWLIISTTGTDLQYEQNGQPYTAASRDGYIELHCPCRD